jgi:alpha-tubulin suppressor-like RCC1 family protein
VVQGLYAGENSWFVKILGQDGRMVLLGSGSNASGQLGDGSYGGFGRLVPVQFPFGFQIHSASGGDGHSMFLSNDGMLFTMS